jgi:hypothetical protein
VVFIERLVQSLADGPWSGAVALARQLNQRLEPLLAVGTLLQVHGDRRSM